MKNRNLNHSDNWATPKEFYDKLNEQCRHFFARFNPKNQYLVSCFHNGKAETIQCYMFDEEYRTSKNMFVHRDYIKSVVRIYDSKTIV